jgi:hypothetical protein
MIQSIVNNGLTATHIHSNKMSKIERIEYIIPLEVFNYNGMPITISIPNIGMIPKLVDWGISEIDLTSSKHNYFPIKFTLDPKDYSTGAYLKEAYTARKNGDIEYNFILYNLIYHIMRGMHYNSEYLNKSDPKQILWLEFFDNLAKNTINNYEEEEMALLLDEVYDLTSSTWFMRNRNVGTTSNCRIPLLNLINYLITLDYLDEETNTIYLLGSPVVKTGEICSINFENRHTTDTILTTFLNSMKEYTSQCTTINPLSKKKPYVVCRDLKEDMDKYSMNSQIDTPIFNHRITSSSQLWLIKNKQFRSSLVMNDLIPYIEYSMPNGPSTYWLHFEPLKYPNLVLPNNERLYFPETMLDTLFDYLPKEIINTPIPSVDLHLTYWDNSKIKDIYTTIDEDLWSGSSSISSGISLNTGYFVVDRNFKNTLTTFLTKKDISIPIGYYKLENNIRGSLVLPTMPPYNEYTSVITITNNQFKFYKYNNFLQMHHTTIVPFLVYVEKDKEFNENNRNVASFGLPVIDTSKPIPSSLNYDIAFESGPILIWNGKITFDRKQMVSEKMDLDTLESLYDQVEPTWDLPEELNLIKNLSNYKYYKLSKTQKNPLVWHHQKDEFAFYADQRSSTKEHVNHILCETFDGYIVSILIEGRGFTAPGIDRAQIASLISLFNIKHAVSLDGGFSAQLLYKYKKDKRYVLLDPEKRSLGLAIHLNFKIK